MTDSPTCSLCEQNSAVQEAVAHLPGEDDQTVPLCQECIERGFEFEDLFHPEVNDDALGYGLQPL